MLRELLRASLVGIQFRFAALKEAKDQPLCSICFRILKGKGPHKVRAGNSRGNHQQRGIEYIAQCIDEQNGYLC